MSAARLFSLVAIKGRERDAKWHNVPPGERWCFVVAHDAEDARRLAAEKLTPRRFKSPWLDPRLTAVNPAVPEGAVPGYGWVGDIAGQWSA